MIKILGLFLVIGAMSALHLPSDVELLTPLDGILFSPEDDTVLERQSLVGHKLIKAIRSKRSAYKVLESPGLRSHFRLSRTSSYPEDSFEEPPKNTKNSWPRKRRELESEAIEDSVEMIDRTPRGTSSGEKRSTEVEMPPDVEELPRPEKQVVEPGYYRQARGHYSDDFEDDSVAEASAVNEGIKARAPRVNFITQQRSIPDMPEARDQKQSMARSEEVYKKPYEAFESPRYVPDYRSRLLDPPPPPQFKGFSDTYDKYRYPDHYEPWRRMRFYDTYMSRTLMPPPPYPAYSNYPEHRFDNPPTAVDMRGYPVYPTPFVNDVTYAPLPRPPGNRNRRIIYYANLPEVVRSPPNVELRYRYNSDYYPAMETYRNFRQREYSKVDNSTPQPTAKLQEQKDQDDGKIEYTRNSGVKVISGLRIQNHQQNHPPDYRKYVDETKIHDFPVRY